MDSQHAPTRLGRALARGLVTGVVRWVACAVPPLVAVVIAPTSTLTSTPAPGHLGAERPTSTRGADRVAQLVGAHDCWTGAAPADVVPSRAVVTLPGRRSAVVDAEVGFAIWLEDAPGELHAFCR